MDYRDALYGLPEEEIQRRQEEEARAERWAAFVEEIRQWMRDGISAHMLIHAVASAMEYPWFTGVLSADLRIQPARNFAETEGWDGVLNAIARAMREEETYRRELVDRR